MIVTRPTAPGKVRTPTSRCLWQREAGIGTPARPTLDGDRRADVAIIGGGYVGLWTAIQIRRLDPACDVVVLEADVCGGGASGRNGGFALTWWAKLPSFLKAVGREEAVRLCRASEQGLDEIARLDSGFVRGGFLWTAVTETQRGAWDASLAAAEEVGAGDVFTRLDPAEVARRSGSPAHLEGVLEPACGTVQPARYACALRDEAVRLGVDVREATPVTRLGRDRPVVLETPSGRVTADVAVIATNAWALALPELRNRMVCISSDIVATRPLPERLAATGWTGGEAVSDSGLMVCYYRTTDDGRVVFGKGGWTIALGGRIGAAFDRHPGRARTVADALARVYPTLADGLLEDWSGPIDRPQHGLPLIGHLGGAEHLIHGVGWSGNGVGPSVTGGRILASLALRRDDEWARSPLVGLSAPRFPPEPIRFAGAHVVRAAAARKEVDEHAGRGSARVVDALVSLAPGSFASGAKK